MADKSGHIEIIAKIKQKNNATFKLIDAKDIEMEDGKSAEQAIDEKQDKIIAITDEDLAKLTF